MSPDQKNCWETLNGLNQRIDKGLSFNRICVFVRHETHDSTCEDNIHNSTITAALKIIKNIPSTTQRLKFKRAYSHHHDNQP